MSAIRGYINTSVEDCKSSLTHCSDLPLLHELLAECERIGHTTRAGYVKSRIRKVEKEATPC